MSSLIKTNELWAGTASHEFHTLAVVDDDVDPEASKPYFDALTFIGPRYSRQHNRQLTTNTAHYAGDAQETEQWHNAFQIDNNDPALVLDCMGRIQRRARGTVGLFKFKIDFTLQEVSTLEDEYAEVRKWNALNKLSNEEIKLLKLEKDMVYLKLKYGTEESELARKGYDPLY